MARSPRSLVQTPLIAVALVALLLGVIQVSNGSSIARAVDEPDIHSLTPSSGSAGTLIQIFGDNLSGATAVHFGAESATFTQVSPSRINAIAPPNVLGDVNVSVTTPNGTSVATDDSEFTYVAGPVVTALSPNAGRPGTIVTVLGSGFSAATSVNFGGVFLTPSILNDGQLTVAAPFFSVGTVVHVRVTTPVGTSLATDNDEFTYLPGPTVTSVTPSVGSAGTQVTITGSGFTGATVVQFGANNVVPTVVSDTVVTAIAPAGALGATVDVRVVTTNGPSPTSDNAKFTYAAGPVITSISPSTGSAATIVTITGTGLTNASLVSFGGTLATPLTVTDSTVTVSAPSRPLGTVNVTITTPLGTSAISAAAQFTYTGIPVITNVSPSTGTQGTVVTLTGSGFVGATSVTFDGVSADFDVITNLQIVVTAPVNSAGASNVRVTTPAGISDVTASTIFTYTSGAVLPVVTGVTPSSGTTGTTVVISGTGFTGATSVSFGGTLAVPISATSTTITVNAPSRSAGTVVVVVTTPNGSSSASSPHTFTYLSQGGTQTIDYTLNFRWSLIVWLGPHGADIDDALSGDLPSTVVLSDVFDLVTAIYRWNGTQQRWEANFPGAGNIPGANDFTEFDYGVAYWIAIDTNGTFNWRVPLNQ